MDTNTRFNLATYLKENHPLFSVSSIFLLVGISLTTLLLNNLIPESFTLLIQLLVAFCSILFLVISWAILLDSFTMRSNERLMMEHNFRKYTISIRMGDLDRAMFILPYLAILVIYQVYLVLFFAIFAPVYLVFFVGLLIFGSLGLRSVTEELKRLENMLRLLRSKEDLFETLSRSEITDDSEFEQYRQNYTTLRNLMLKYIEEGRNLKLRPLKKEDLDELRNEIEMLDEQFRLAERGRGSKTDPSNL